MPVFRTPMFQMTPAGYNTSPNCFYTSMRYKIDHAHPKGLKVPNPQANQLKSQARCPIPA